MARRPSETLQTAQTFENAFSAACAGRSLGLKHSFSLFEHVGFRQNAQTTEAVLQAGLCLRRSDGKGILQRSRPVCFMKIVDFMRTITPFHGVHTYADTNRRRYD